VRGGAGGYAASGGTASLRGRPPRGLRGEEDEGSSRLLASSPTLVLTDSRLTDSGCYTPHRIAFGVEVRSVSYADQVPTGGIARERARDVA
jgi:hypothetical protein